MLDGRFEEPGPVQRAVGFQIETKSHRMRPGHLFTPFDVDGVIGVVQPIDIVSFYPGAQGEWPRMVPEFFQLDQDGSPMLSAPTSSIGLSANRV